MSTTNNENTTPTPKLVFCRCGRIVSDVEIAYEKTNDEGEEYSTAECHCICGAGYHAITWGRWDNDNEARTELNEKIVEDIQTRIPKSAIAEKLIEYRNAHGAKIWKTKIPDKLSDLIHVLRELNTYAPVDASHELKICLHRLAKETGIDTDKIFTIGELEQLGKI